VLDALAGPDLHIFSDALNHASIVDACHRARRRGAEVDVYAHADACDLERRVAASERRFKLVVTETVFSMDGDLAPLSAIDVIRSEYGVSLVTDESHATLVYGPTGRGVAEQVGVSADVHVGTASKAVGALGGFVACDERMARLLRSRARTYVFSTALPIPVVAAIRAALDVDHGALRERLWANVRRFCDAVGRAPVSPIVPVVIGDERATMDAGRRVLEAGFMVAAVRPPTVPAGTSRLRVTLAATHTAEEIDRLAAVLGQTACRTTLDR
jgi:8-amino-7-oxononanoate synthase